MKIRRATEEDAGAISALVYTLSAKHIAHEFSEQGRQALLRAMAPESIRNYIQAGYRYHVAEIDGRIVGVVGIKGNKHLYHLFVDEAYQRRGIARALWRQAMDACLANGNPGEFTVNASRAAQPVYERLGFKALSGPRERGGVIAIPMKLVVGN